MLVSHPVYVGISNTPSYFKYKHPMRGIFSWFMQGADASQAGN